MFVLPQAVEDASDKAAQKVLKPNLSSAKRSGKVAALSSVNQLREHDSALTEGNSNICHTLCSP